MEFAILARARLGLTLVVGLAGCPWPPPPRVQAPPSRPAPPHVTPTSPTAPIEPFVGERIGPLRREAPLVSEAREASSSRRGRPKNARATAVGTDGMRLDIRCDKGATLVRGRGKPLSLWSAHTLVSAHVAPDGRFAAAQFQDGSIALLEFSTGRTRNVEHRGVPYWVDGTLVIRDGCRNIAVDPRDAAARELAPACGTFAGVGGGALWIAEPPPGPNADPTVASAIVAIAADGSSERVVFTAELPQDPQVSHDGNVLCGLFQRGQQDLLQCRTTRGGRFERVALAVVGGPVFAPDAARLVVRVGDPHATEQDLHLVDFQDRSIRKLGRIAHRRVVFLPGATHVVAYEGDRGLVFAPLTGELLHFGDKTDDWRAVAPIHGTAAGFYATRQGAGNCPDVVRIDLPTGDTSGRDVGRSVVIEDPPAEGPPTQ